MPYVRLAKMLGSPKGQCILYHCICPATQQGTWHKTWSHISANFKGLYKMIYISKCEIKMLMIICAYLASNFCNPCSPPNPNIIVLEGT